MDNATQTSIKEKAISAVFTFALTYVLPSLIRWLRQQNFIDAAQAFEAKGAVLIAKEIRVIKTYSAPEDFPPQKQSGSFKDPVNTPNNLT